MLKFQLNSGKIVELNLAPMGEALNLYRAIIHECKGAGLDLVIPEGSTIADVLIKNTEALLNVIGSQYVMEATMACASKVMYDKQRFSMELFNDNESARGDFFGLLAIIALENIRPFFPNLHTFFNAIESQFLRS